MAYKIKYMWKYYRTRRNKRYVKDLKEINCSGSSLTSITNIVDSKIIYCQHNYSLTSISNIKGLKELYCYYCHSLTSIPNI